MIVMVTLSA